MTVQCRHAPSLRRQRRERRMQELCRKEGLPPIDFERATTWDQYRKLCKHALYEIEQKIQQRKKAHSRLPELEDIAQHPPQSISRT